jgi:hypothetical protein
MPSADTVLNSSKKVFAHYLSPFPLSIDNQPASQDYYTRNFLNPHGEGGKFLSAGGFFRARPLPVSPQSNPNWRTLNMEQEIRMAIARGINGWTFDLMGIGDTQPGGKLDKMIQAVQAVDPRFKIVVMPDMAALGSDTGAAATIIQNAHNLDAGNAVPSLYHWPDGRLVVSPFLAESVSPGAWSSMLNGLKAHGINVAFFPTFLSLSSSRLNGYAPISVGLGIWSMPGIPAQLSWTLGNGSSVRASSAPHFLAGFTPQRYRPISWTYDEAQNSLAYRNAWTGVIQANADIAHITTWNDFSEGGQIQPVTSDTGDSGNGFYNLTGYYSTWFRTGSAPPITHDVLYYFYRRERHDAYAPIEGRATNTPQTPYDNIEVLSFLTAPGTISITIGGHTYTQSASGGVQSFTVPLAAGTPNIQLMRNGASVIQITGNPIYPMNQGLPSGALDLTYWSGSASAAGTCTIPMP